MKLKILILMLAIALTSVAQTAAPTATPAQDSKACTCCNHDQAGNSAKPGMKCPMMSGDKAAMKCPMMAKDGKMADGTMCCSSNKCPMHAKSGKGSGCCCGNMDEKKPAA